MLFGLYTKKEMEQEFERRMYQEQRFRSIGDEFTHMAKEIDLLRNELFELRRRIEPPRTECTCREGDDV